MFDAQTANVHTLSYVGSLKGQSARDSDSWFTPSEYVEAARYALDGIDLDPYSSDDANRVVKADHIFTREDPAPAGHLWPRVLTCWMNPPYSRFILPDACTQFVTALKHDRISRGIVLVNNATETRAVQLLMRHATAVCFPENRIGFTNADGKRTTRNTRGQVFFYFGNKTHANRFRREFRFFGPVL